ncbi:Linker_histone domain-containing protein [Cephalotus follicularis]|uniref:Linker_histone domain-containing protein n=1 Tax=Cephalotus follicularis TaxID=3775 RepID=A0A1Q3C284_CEPFO|nr:Linker_histone domain-containing protein [Cephalotus follicularis]
MVTVESELLAVDPSAAAEEPKLTEKPVEEKKNPNKAPKEKKLKNPKTATHPPYFQMIKEALLAINEKNGSSPYAIAKYMEENHKAILPVNFKKMLGLQLKNSAARGKLIKIKASYKLSEVTKKDKGATRPTTRSKKPEPKKRVGAKKAKKSAPATKPKQLKSIRKAKKAAA